MTILFFDIFLADYFYLFAEVNYDSESFIEKSKQNLDTSYDDSINTLNNASDTANNDLAVSSDDLNNEKFSEYSNLNNKSNETSENNFQENSKNLKLEMAEKSLNALKTEELDIKENVLNLKSSKLDKLQKKENNFSISTSNESQYRNNEKTKKSGEIITDVDFKIKKKENSINENTQPLTNYQNQNIDTALENQLLNKNDDNFENDNFENVLVPRNYSKNFNVKNSGSKNIKIVNKLEEDYNNELNFTKIEKLDENIIFDKDLYTEIRYKREKGDYKKIESFSLPNIDLSYIGDYKAKNLDKIKTDIEKSLIQMRLPYDSRLSIAGRKMIAFDYGIINYKSDNEADQTENPSDIKEGIDMRQEMQIRVNGKIGNKINVNVNYDDSKETDRQDISIVYKGYKKGDLIKESDDGAEQIFAEEDDIVEEVAFGDIMLEIPQTEFIGYRRTLFGLRLKAKYKRFNFLAVGSQTQGIIEKKEYRGNITEEHKIIDDRNFIKRSYYKLYFDNTHKNNDFPIVRGSEEIYLFDQNTNTSGYTTYEKDIESYFGGLDRHYTMKKLQVGIDYEIDSIDGIVKIKRYIGNNYVLAVDYTKKDGTKLSSNGKIKYLKDEYNTSTIDNEIKWYYDLGNTNIVRGDFGTDFIFRVIDVNNNIVTSFTYNNIEIDYYNGILKFKTDRPFGSLNNDIYIDENAISKYKIEVEYSYERSSNSTYMIGKTIVEGSESIVLNGTKLVKDQDYVIDYDIGLITLLNIGRLNSDSLLEITYEYLPFGGQYQQTLLGGRAEYRIDENNYWGLSGIYSSAGKPAEIPSVYSPPKSVMVLDSDISYKIDRKTIKMPFDITIKGEIAQSIQNPNIFGKALVDNMESVTDLDSPSLTKEYWQIAANPGDDGYGKNAKPLILPSNITQENIKNYNFGKFNLFNEDIDVRIINPEIDLNKERKVQTLGIGVNSLNPSEQASIVYVINKEGVNYMEKTFLEAWIYADKEMSDSKPSIYFRYGGIDEDVDGKGGFEEAVGRCLPGHPKTEDINRDSLLSVGEDIGWSYFPNGAARMVRIGAENGRLNTTDLNENGILDTDDGYGGEFKILKVDWQGWKKFVIPLNIKTTDINPSTGKPKWEVIKNLRITVSNDNAIGNTNGTLKFYEIAVTGNKWTEITTNLASLFEVKSVDEDSDPNYISIANARETKDEYEKLYKNYNTEEIIEKAISIEYKGMQQGGSGHTIQRLNNEKKYDFSKYKKIKFFLYGDGNNEEFFIQFGADENNYFEYTKKIDWRNYWEILEISLEDTKNNITGDNKPDGIPDGFSPLNSGSLGSPRLDNIRYIKIGIKNNNWYVVDGKIYVNDIYLEGAIGKNGIAYKTELILDLEKNIKITGNYKHIDSDFETINTGSQNDDLLGVSSITSGRQIENYGGRIEINTLKYLNTSFEINREEKETPQNFLGVFNILEEGKTVTDTKMFSTIFNKENFPKVSLYYYTGKGKFYDMNLSTTTVSLYNLREYQIKDVYQVNTDYDLPFKGQIYSQKVYMDYRKEKLSSDIFNRPIGETYSSRDYDLEQMTEESSIGTDISILNKIYIRPKYSYIENTENLDDSRWFPKKKQEKADLNADVTIIKWLKPNFEYYISKREDYNIDYNNIQVSTYTTKDLYLENSGSVSLDLYANNIFPKIQQINSMSLTTKFELKDTNAWTGVDGSYSFVDKWFSRNFGGLISENQYFSDLEFGKQSTFSQDDISTLSLKYNPFDFIKAKNLWQKPIKSINTRTSFQKTVSQNLSYISDTTVFPEILLEIKDIENLFFLEKFVSNGDLVTQFMKKQEFSQNNYDKLTNNFDTKYRFNIFKKFDISINYKNENYEEYNLTVDTNNQKTRDVNILNKGAQVSFNYSIWRITTRIDQNNQKEFLVNSDLKWLKENIFSLKFDLDFNVTNGIKIPFFKKRIKIENRIKVENEIKTTQRRSDVLEDNKDIYDFIINSEYNISSNFQFKLGAKYRIVNFVLKNQSNYDAIQISTEASIIF
ncbi:MAG: hypothetical protein LBF97_05250 [Elusimicrobiota bacterium]|nr:hypothetical protein [Elusimicrobiota bacterium]